MESDSFLAVATFYIKDYNYDFYRYLRLIKFKTNRSKVSISRCFTIGFCHLDRESRMRPFVGSIKSVSITETCLNLSPLFPNFSRRRLIYT